MSLAQLDPLELKFLLRLLAYAPSYRIKISQIQLESKTPASERDRVGRALCSRGFVEYIEEITQYQLKPPGKALLKSDPTSLPVSPEQLELLKAAATKTATPGQAKKVPAADRQPLLGQLKERGLITASKVQIKEVWLTPQGLQYLMHDCVPKSPQAKLSFSMVGTYLTFLRQSLGPGGPEAIIGQSLSDLAPVAPAPTSAQLSPETLLDTIRQLDQQLSTGNFLPIFHLRAKLQPPLSRADLDQLLYELQSQDLIEFSTLQDVANYSESEAAAGIPQNIGGALFYISVTE